MTIPQRLDAVVVGAGFSGLYMVKKLRDLGFSVHAFETGDGVGGTWYWNRYPGARCDVESMFYSYSFDPELEQEWHWTERYPAQPEILRYLNHVADRYDLRRDISLSTKVVSARYDEQTERWTVATDTGVEVDAQFVITAVGCLSNAQIPDFPGAAAFTGETYHTGHWPREGVDFTGKRVAVIGTGSSGVQAIPVIAQQAAHLTVFQRTPNFSVPAHNRPMAEEDQAHVKAEYPRLRAEARQSFGGNPPTGPIPRNVLEMSPDEALAELDRRWEEGGVMFMTAFLDTMTNAEANEVSAEYVRRQIRRIVADPETAELLCPSGFPLGSKRLTVDTDYFATFNRDNVTLVSLKEEPIETITPTGIRVAGREYEVDAIVFATGYDAMTGSLTRLGIEGVGGQTLHDKWAHGPRTYLGLATAGFPNLFMVTAPGSPSVLSNMVVSIEQHVDWIADHLVYLRDNGFSRSEADPVAEDEWVEHVNTVANYTLFPKGPSWYMGANIPGKTRVFMPYAGGVGPYRQLCDEIAADGYRGFVLSPATDSADVRSRDNNLIRS